MAAYPKPRLTPEEYLEIERAAESRHEYFKGEMFAMAGGTPRHSLIGANVTGELRFTDDRADTIVNPSLIVEVLSPSVEVYRKGADGRWSLSDFAGLEAICAFESVSCQIPLSRIYHRVTFDANPFPRQAVAVHPTNAV